ncbi:hypothetical protein P67b_00006 [Ruegeria phage Tedan]|nr:hypothetical protein P67b_00006 [Ruegeria phage Tedan]
MGVFDPDDFEDQPYVGGLNQLGHVIFGAGLVGLTSLFLPVVPLGLLTAGAIYLAWEAYQLKRKQAKLTDYVADLIYWTIGAGTWAHLMAGGLVTGYATLFPLVPLICWTVEYVRIAHRDLWQ